MQARRSRRWFLTLVSALIGMGGVWAWKVQQQDALNRQLTAALMEADSKQAMSLVNAGADPNARLYPAPLPPLQLALRRLWRHAPVFNNHSPTALMFACGAGAFLPNSPGRFDHYHGEDLPLINAMLAHGANVNAADSMYNSAFYYAATEKRPHIALLLLEHGANVNQKDSVGATPLMRVAYSGYADMTRLLLEHGANVSLEDGQGQTALFYAVPVSANTDVIRLLVTHGADPGHSNQFGYTPLKFAQDHQNPELIALLNGRGE